MRQTFEGNPLQAVSWTQDIVALLGDAPRVLEIDGPDGSIAAALRTRAGRQVIGAAITTNRTSSNAGYDSVVSLLPGEGQQMTGLFDGIVCHALLESVKEPLHWLHRLRAHLSPEGCIVGHVANHVHERVIRSLAAGNITYGSHGSLRPHQIRLYTRRELARLAYRGCFEADVIRGLASDSSPSCETELALPAFDGEPERFLFRFCPQVMPSYSLTSIIIVTWNELAYTRKCVESVIEVTDEPYELIFVDNGSRDGTVEYLQSIPGSRLIANSENRGFPAAVNQGLAVAKGTQVLLLNNDCLVTTGWLRRMLDALQSDSRIGLVGPCTNYTAGRQCIGSGYGSLSDLEGFAWQRAERHHGLRLDCSPLCGFCLLIRRDVVDEIGGLDERFGLGICDDDDLSIRAERAGYRLVAACDAYVHHFGSRTFFGAGIDVDALRQRNQEAFREKMARLDEESPLRSDPVNIDRQSFFPTGVADAIARVERSLDSGNRKSSKLSVEASAVPGMTSLHIRHFLNALCSEETCSYLEVGCLGGATLIAASYRNEGRFIGVDDFSEAWGTDMRDALNGHLHRFKAECSVEFVEKDCWEFAARSCSKSIEVMFYDGAHTYADHLRVCTQLFQMLKDLAIVVVDDWNESDVRDGTRDGLALSGFKVRREWELTTDRNGDSRSWWNGIFVAVLERLPTAKVVSQ